jgi:hypothetical protein
VFLGSVESLGALRSRCRDPQDHPQTDSDRFTLDIVQKSKCRCIPSLPLREESEMLLAYHLTDASRV